MENLDTLEVTIVLSPKDPWSDILVAELSELGFDSFVQTDSGLQAFAQAKLDVDNIMTNLSCSSIEDVDFSWEKKVIPHQNWNAKWEADFHPVFIKDIATILAPFHDKALAIGHTVVIQPQMSFGTGHHQTTWMMTKALFEIDKMPAKVLDMGAGTGVLSIFAEQLGAERVLAIDIEDWSAVNASENAERNGCTKIESVCGDVDKINGEKFGLIIANINKNVLKKHMSEYAKALLAGGTLLLSGFFGSDVDELVTFAEQFGLTKNEEYAKDEWAGIRLSKLDSNLCEDK
ncbi:MAG: ribosomal protein L11 methyltransferase [Flavobacteriaceae bacterium]|jgi:ribosomal protein L11 methyltransferase